MIPEPVGLAAMWSGIHLLRVMVNRGLVSPNEVDEIYGSLLEGIQAGPPELAALVESRLEKQFAELHQYAEQHWIGKGKSNPK